jgi:hypothetical protein
VLTFLCFGGMYRAMCAVRSASCGRTTIGEAVATVAANAARDGAPASEPLFTIQFETQEGTSEVALADVVHLWAGDFDNEHFGGTGRWRRAGGWCGRWRCVP